MRKHFGVSDKVMPMPSGAVLNDVLSETIRSANMTDIWKHLPGSFLAGFLVMACSENPPPSADTGAVQAPARVTSQDTPAIAASTEAVPAAAIERAAQEEATVQPRPETLAKADVTAIDAGKPVPPPAPVQTEAERAKSSQTLAAEDAARTEAERKAGAEALAASKAEADQIAVAEAAARRRQEQEAQAEAARTQAVAEQARQAEAARAQAAAQAEEEAAAARTRAAEADAAASAAPVPADGIVTSGNWIKKKRTSKGSWSIVRENGALFVELDEDFSTRNAPDLKLFLSPLPASDVTRENAVNGSLLISLLDSNKGAQRYAIPDLTSLDGYRSILIHCEDYTVLWSAADL